MQHKPVGRCLILRWCVKGITQNWMTHGHHMHPQLMRASCNGSEGDLACVCRPPGYFPVGEGRFSKCDVHFLTRAIGPVCNERQIDTAFGRVRYTGNPGRIAFLNLSVLKSLAQKAVCVRIPGKDHQARGFHIQTMNREGGLILPLEARNLTICFFWSPARYTEQARRFVDDDNMIVGIKDVGAGIWWRRIHHGQPMA